MASSRRDFIKFVVVGSVAAGCPIDKTLLAPPDSKSSAALLVHGEHFEVCHQVRDGHSFERPDATRKTDIVIVGGGVAGLSAAYFLRGKDWLLLEKEPQFGGNALQEEFRGQVYGTGSAYAYRGDEGDQLASEIGLKLPFVNMPDPTIVNKAYIPDTWKTGLGQLPYPKEVRDSFKKFRDDMMKINVREKMAELAIPATSKPTTFFLFTRHCASSSAPRFLTKMTASPSAPESSPIFKSCFPNSTWTPWKCASTAAAIRCSWPSPAITPRIGWPPPIR